MRTRLSRFHSILRVISAAGLAAWLGSAAALAQEAASLTGRVTGPDGAPVPAAVVALYSREAGVRRVTTAETDGRYELTGLMPGEYLMEVSAPGFAAVEAAAVSLGSGERATKDVALQLPPVRSRVVVTASATPLMLEEVAKATDTVSGDEIRLRNEFSVAEALRLTPGFRVRQQQGPGSFTTIHVRGLRSYDTALLVDGVRMRDAADPQGSATPLWEDLLVTAPERLEVLRGSGSSLYGTNAIGGVVNVVTAQGGGAPRGEVLAEGGGLGMVRGLAKVAGGAFDNRLLYAGGATHLNVTQGLDGVNPYRNTSGQGSVEYRFTPAVSLSTRAWLSDAWVRLSDAPFIDPALAPNLPAAGIVPGVPLPDDQVRRIETGRPFDPGRATYVPSLNDPDSGRSGRFRNIATVFQHQVTPGISYRAVYQFVETNRRFDDGPAGVRFEPMTSSRSRFDGRIHIAEARADVQAGRHQLLSGGYEFEQEAFDNWNTDENPDPGLRTDNRVRIRQRSHAAFLQDQISLLGRRLVVTLSGRMQAFRLREPRFDGGRSPYEGIPVDSPKTAWTGDAAAAYMIRASGTKIRAHVGNAYRAPSAFERFGSSFFFGAFSPFGDPRLRPERALSVDGGLDQWLAGSRVRLSATYFYTRLQETIVFDFTGLIPPDDPFGRFGGYLNLPGGLARGVETSASLTPWRGTTINASYTYTDSRRRRPWDADGRVRRAIGISRNTFTLLASQWFGRRVNVTADLFTTDDYLAGFFTFAGTRALRLDGFTKADLTARYVLPVRDSGSLEFYGKVENFLNRKFYEAGYRSPGVWAIGGLRWVF